MDDVDAVQAQISRNMLQSGDWVTARLDGVKYLDTGKPEWIEMAPIINVVNEALKAAGKN